MNFIKLANFFAIPELAPYMGFTIREVASGEDLLLGDNFEGLFIPGSYMNKN